MNTRWLGFTGLAAVALLLLGACARAVVVTRPTPPMVGAEQTGLASWYGHPYHGRRTASGEVYEMRDLTAAHRTLPLGTRLMVTNLDTGQAVEVRVNDRGPFVEGRMLDLSYGAAILLGAERPGVIPVRLQVISLPATSRLAGSGPAPASGEFSVQLGAFVSRARADSLRVAVERSSAARRARLFQRSGGRPLTCRCRRAFGAEGLGFGEQRGSLRLVPRVP